MKHFKHLSFLLLIVNTATASKQNDSTGTTRNTFPLSKITIEPAIGIKPYPISDVLFSNVAQWNLKKRLSLVSYTSYTWNSAFLRDFNYIHTDYNYSLTQKFGVGTSLYTRNSSQTLSFLGGVQYDAFRETLDHPEFEKASMAVSSIRPDFGLLYHLQLGRNKFFFSYRMYVPLYAYPLLTSDINALDGNLANITFELGIGIRLR